MKNTVLSPPIVNRLFDVYPLFDIEPIRGEGCYVYDAEGTRYLDFYGGHAVISVGHSRKSANNYNKSASIPTPFKTAFKPNSLTNSPNCPVAKIIVYSSVIRVQRQMKMRSN